MSKESIVYGDTPIEFEVIHEPIPGSKLRIHVHYDGTVQVIAPPAYTSSKIRDGVRKRARWINKHLEKVTAQRKHLLPRRYISGESHLYLGKRYPLKIVRSIDPDVKLLRGRLHIYNTSSDTDTVRDLLNGWYRQRAADVFERRYSEVSSSIPWLNGNAPSIQLRHMTQQWGSCSPKGKILLNPSLVKAPRDCIDYVIVHELCHLQEHNHSQRFYRLLSQTLPSWEIHKARLDHMAELLLNK